MCQVSLCLGILVPQLSFNYLAYAIQKNSQIGNFSKNDFELHSTENLELGAWNIEYLFISSEITTIK